MEYPESIRSRIFDWYDGPPSFGNRLEPKVKDVTPCSEYTRYTVEGILKDPRSELSAVIDVEALGPIFLNSNLKDPKWSTRLGYGIAVEGEDTRIHIHRNGKYIIRRALDRQHAESTYVKIVNMIKPTLYDSNRNRYLWDLVREVLSGRSDLERIAPFINWPEGNGDLHKRYEKIREGAKEIENELIAPIRKAIIEGKVVEAGSLNERIDEMTRSVSERMMDDIDIYLGRISALIWTRFAVKIFNEQFSVDTRDLKDWDELITGISVPNDDFYQISASRLHYLLSPVV
jgi:hypothetical protein